MKKKLFSATLIAVLFASCTKEEMRSDQVKGKIEIDLLTHSGLELRSIVSQEATNNVTKVAVYAYKFDGSNYMLERNYTVNDWSAGTSFKRFEIPQGEEPTPGDYIFMAVGEEERSEYVFDQIERLSDFRAILERKVGTTEYFAGTSSQAQIQSSGGRVVLEMKRKVAGIMGYFSNVPQELNGKSVGYLRLVAKRINLVQNLLTGVGDKPEDNEINILDFDLLSQGTDPSLHVYTGNSIPGVRVAKLNNSQLAGAYLLPIDYTILYLRLYEKDGTTILKEWPVLYNGNEKFQLEPNFLYTLGVKPTTLGTVGDQPIDLMKTFVLALAINSNWDALGDLTLKE